MYALVYITADDVRDTWGKSRRRLRPWTEIAFPCGEPFMTSQISKSRNSLEAGYDV